ncbi:MAG: hypothetical protein JWM28_783 [Chitinophagaceae bacterium]|nr:hypothetical protein [Chitinophagaceae bacterium]
MWASGLTGGFFIFKTFIFAPLFRLRRFRRTSRMVSLYCDLKAVLQKL